MADQHPYGYEERFKFTGKERDSETGYDYFGARFYASLFGFWLSVDPFSDKYPNVSPYAYCGWNPVKYVDPDGKDVWELDENGKMVDHQKTDQKDEFVIGGQKLTFNPKTVTSWSYTDSEASFTFKNQSDAFAAFSFLADRAKVEYALFCADDESKLSTQYFSDHYTISNILLMTLPTLSIFVHNHPCNTEPSGFSPGAKKGDKFAAEFLTNFYHRDVSCFVYLPKSGVLMPYDNKTSYAATSCGLIFPPLHQ